MADLSFTFFFCRILLHESNGLVFFCVFVTGFFKHPQPTTKKQVSNEQMKMGPISVISYLLFWPGGPRQSRRRGGVWCGCVFGGTPAKRWFFFGDVSSLSFQSCVFCLGPSKMLAFSLRFLVETTPEGVPLQNGTPICV